MNKRLDEHDRNYHSHEVNCPASGEKGQAISSAYPKLHADEISLPSAVIDASALENNLRWMQQFADKQQLKLAPHGKTSMTPDFSVSNLHKVPGGSLLQRRLKLKSPYRRGQKTSSWPINWWAKPT